jgi:NOL1/NOP2/fmu family ribosome biogenesis protein
MRKLILIGLLTIAANGAQAGESHDARFRYSVAPWWALVPPHSGGAQVIELPDAIAEPNPCGQGAFRVVAGHAKGEPRCIKGR